MDIARTSPDSTIECLYAITHTDSDKALSLSLGLSGSTVAMWRKRGQCPRWAGLLCELHRAGGAVPDPLGGLGEKQRALVVALIDLLRLRPTPPDAPP